VLNARTATFLDKGQRSPSWLRLRAAPAEPGQRHPGPGHGERRPGPADGRRRAADTGIYSEPTTAATKDGQLRHTAATATDASPPFRASGCRATFYNGNASGDLNLVLTFTRSQVEGVISANHHQHHIDTIGADEYLQLGEVTNTPAAAVNNGVVVSAGHRLPLDRRPVPPTLTSLTLAATPSSRPRAPQGHHDGPTASPPIAAGGQLQAAPSVVQATAGKVKS